MTVDVTKVHVYKHNLYKLQSSVLIEEVSTPKMNADFVVMNSI